MECNRTEQSKRNLLGTVDCTIFEKSQLAMNQAVYDPNEYNATEIGFSSYMMHVHS